MADEFEEGDLGSGAVELTSFAKLNEEDHGGDSKQVEDGEEEIATADGEVDLGTMMVNVNLDKETIEFKPLHESPLLQNIASLDEDEDTSGAESDSVQLIHEQRRDSVSENKHTSSIPGASFNFINSIIGAGIIGIPSALREAGLIPGILLLVFVAVITDYTVILLVKNGHLSKKWSYQEMMRSAFGKVGLIYLTIAQFLFPFFAMVGYVVIVGDTFSIIIESILNATNAPPSTYFLADTRFIKVIMVLFVMMPVSLFRNISRLEKFSAFAILCITFIAVVTVYEAASLFCAVRCVRPDCCDNVVDSWIISKDVIQSVGVMAFAFVCHHNTFLIYTSLRDRSVQRFAVVSHISVSVSFVFCAVLGLSGFVTFLHLIRGDLLNNYCHDVAANLARFFYSIVIMLTYPIECFVTREVMEIALSMLPDKTVAWIPHRGTKELMRKFLYTPRHKSLPRHIILTIFLVIVTLAIGLTTDDLEIVLAFNGCFNATPIAFILPTMCFLKLSPLKWRSKEKIIALLVCIFGLVVMIIGTIQAVIAVVQSYSSNEPSNPDWLYCHINTTNETICARAMNSSLLYPLVVGVCNNCQQFCTLTNGTF